MLAVASQATDNPSLTMVNTKCDLFFVASFSVMWDLKVFAGADVEEVAEKTRPEPRLGVIPSSTSIFSRQPTNHSCGEYPKRRASNQSVRHFTRYSMAKDDNNRTKAQTQASSSASAKSRVAQISDHVDIKPFESGTGRRRRRSSENTKELPADHSDVMEQLRTLRSIAANPNPLNPGYARQKQAGKLWVRERVEKLLDPGSFREVGSVSGTVKWRQLDGIKEVPEDFIPSNNVQGFGKLGGRDILITADDFSLRAGEHDF